MSEGKTQAEIDVEMVEKHLRELSEFFDSVQIFCTRYNANKVDGCDEEGTTLRMALGKGNWFARYGQVRHWLEQQKVIIAKEE